MGLIFESDANREAGSEVAVVTYDTYADLLANTIASSVFLDLNVNSAFSIGGLLADGPLTPPPNGVSEPGTLALLGLGLAGLAAARRRRR